MIDLEFDSVSGAEDVHATQRGLRGRVDVMRDPQARIVETVETKEYSPQVYQPTFEKRCSRKSASCIAPVLCVMHPWQVGAHLPHNTR